MALDPSIALQVKPLSIPDPMESYGKALQLKNLMNQQAAFGQQQQLGAQQLQTGALDLQQKQLDVQDQEKMRQAWKDANGDPDKMFALATQRGVGPKAMTAMQATIMQAKEARAKLSTTELENANTKNDMSSALLQPVLAETDPVKQKALWDQQMQMGVQRGAFTPQEAAQHPYPGSPEAVKNYASALVTDKWMTAQGAKQRGEAAASNAANETNKTNATLPGLQADALGKQRVELGSRLGAATTPDAYKAALDAAPHGIAQAFPPPEKVFDQSGKMIPGAQDSVRQVAMTPEQQTQAGQAKDNAAQTAKRDAENARNHLSTESISRQNEAISAGRLKLEQTVNGMKYGPGMQEYWVKQLQDNPDSIKEMPPELRSTVGQGFTKATGLPLPTPASGASQTQETAARNFMDSAAFVQRALMNPEIRANLGPILGRLGNTEQDLGTSLHLSPEASNLVQELRTRMRYMTLQEGRALFGGRIPQQLMKDFQSGSPNPKMDPDMLQGALNGAMGSAQATLDNVDKQRFGGKMRSPAMRGSTPAATAAPQNGPKPGDVVTVKGQKYTVGTVHPDGSWDPK